MKMELHQESEGVAKERKGRRSVKQGNQNIFDGRGRFQDVREMDEATSTMVDCMCSTCDNRGQLARLDVIE
jgi:hypothetical protein